MLLSSITNLLSYSTLFTVSGIQFAVKVCDVLSSPIQLQNTSSTSNPVIFSDTITEYKIIFINFDHSVPASDVSPMYFLSFFFLVAIETEIETPLCCCSNTVELNFLSKVNSFYSSFLQKDLIY